MTWSQPGPQQNLSKIIENHLLESYAKALLELWRANVKLDSIGKPESTQEVLQEVEEESSDV